MDKPIIEINHFEMPRPQAFWSSEGPKLGGTRGEVQVRLATDHGVWEAGENIREALRSLMRHFKGKNMPHRIEDYTVVLIDTVRCDAYDKDGVEYKTHRLGA